MKQLVLNKAQDCQRCSLCENRNQVVFGEGSYKRGIMVIGGWPTTDEDELGRPFVGRSGRKLDKWFKTIGLSRKRDFYATNVVKCMALPDEEPTPEETLQCRRWLGSELRRTKPWLVIPVGEYAARVVLDNPKFGIVSGIGMFYPKMLYHLNYYTSDFVLVYPIMHPKFVLRNHFAEDQVLTALERLHDEVLA